MAEQTTTFLNAIENQARPMCATSWEILNLDDSFPGFSTLQQNIMAVNSKLKPSEGSRNLKNVSKYFSKTRSIKRQRK
jgi:hypothetical protein